jgi:hypothetical protein
VCIGGLALLALIVAFQGGYNQAPSLPDAPGTLRAANFGDAWPFTVDEGRVECRRGQSVVFITGGTEYAVNGAAQTVLGLPGIDPIWRNDPKIAGAKVNIGPVLDAGLELCR